MYTMETQIVGKYLQYGIWQDGKVLQISFFS